MTAPWRMVRREERALMLTLALTYFLLIAAFTIAKITRDSLFLSELPASYLPFLYLGLAALSGLATVALGKLRKGNAGQRLSLILIVTGLSLLLFALWFRRVGGQATIAFYLWTGVYGVSRAARWASTSCRAPCGWATSRRRRFSHCQWRADSSRQSASSQETRTGGLRGGATVGRGRLHHTGDFRALERSAGRS